MGREVKYLEVLRAAPRRQVNTYTREITLGGYIINRFKVLDYIIEMTRIIIGAGKLSDNNFGHMRG